jgi:NAD(P)-dependent dehydrogenase (short-subunit alcohol dehydrogenase family)
MSTTGSKPLAVVTGASRGIGRELAKQFAQHGFDLLISSTGPGLVEAKREREGLGASVTTTKADLATHEGVETLHRAIEADSRPVEAIAINAGVGVGGDFTATVAQQGFDALMAGKDHVIAGSLKTKAMAAMAKVLPDTANAEQHRSMAEPDSARD